jgi:hypothetical protein
METKELLQEPKTGVVPPRLVIAHGEKGGVGKTTVARLIADYLLARKLPFRAYDGEGADGQLLRFHGDVTSPIQFTDAASIAPVLDHLMSGGTAPLALVDLGARAGTDLKSWLYRGGALEESGAGRLGVTIVYVVGGAIDSVGHLNQCFAALGKDVEYLLVKNLGVASHFTVYDQSNVRKQLLAAGAREMVLPALDSAVFQSVDRASIPFSAFVDNASRTFSYTERRYCRTWLRESFAALDVVAPLIRP